MKISLRYFLLFSIAIFFLPNAAQSFAVDVHPAIEVEEKESTKSVHSQKLSKKQLRKLKRKKRKQKRLEKRLKKFQKKWEMRAQKKEKKKRRFFGGVTDEPKFQLGIILVLAAVILAILSVLPILGSIFYAISGISLVVGIIFMVLAMLEYN